MSRNWDSSDPLSDFPSSPVVSLRDIEAIAHRRLPRNALDYYRSGADQMSTLGENRSAFGKYRILPRVLIDVSRRNMATTVLGGRAKVRKRDEKGFISAFLPTSWQVSMPIGIAPTAMQRMAHPEGECASARAAQEAGTVFILSTIATSSIEEVARAAPDAETWFQPYIYRDRKVGGGEKGETDDRTNASISWSIAMNCTT